MDTMTAFMFGSMNKNKELMVFDWNKAAERIRETKCEDAYAGLRGDWEWTGGSIYSDGKPDTDSYTYLASTWAVPELVVNGQSEPCYKMQSQTPNWDAKTKWPESALKILNN